MVPKFPQGQGNQVKYASARVRIATCVSPLNVLERRGNKEPSLIRPEIVSQEVHYFRALLTPL